MTHAKSIKRIIKTPVPNIASSNKLLLKLYLEISMTFNKIDNNK